MKKILASILLVFSMTAGVFMSSAHVILADYDTTPPVINTVTINKASITKPGVMTVTLDVTENDTGVSGIDIYFFHIDGKGGTSGLVQHVGASVGDGEWDENPKFSGKYTFELPVSSQNRSGEYYLSGLYIKDMAGNGNSYHNITGTGTPELISNYDHVCKINGRSTFSVEDEFNVAFQVYITNPQITTRLKNMKDGETAFINFDNNNHIAKKEWFDAIKNSQKRIVFSNNGIQWIFEGKDIKGSIKNIDLETRLKQVNESEDGYSAASLNIIFKDNGILPGQAQIRLKSDYLHNLYQLTGKWMLYYINNNVAQRENTSFANVLDGTDHWCYFTITHNSTYAITNKVLNIKKRPIKVSKISISGLSKQIAAGKKIKLTAKVYPGNASNKSVSWKSNNKKIATVTQKGLVTLKKRSGGKKVKITVAAKDGSGKKAVYWITSKKGIVKKIRISGKKTIKAGRRTKLKAKVSASKGANKKLKWTSSNKKYAKVSATGKVTTYKAGKGKRVKITASATDGSSKKKVVTIKLK